MTLPLRAVKYWRDVLQDVLPCKLWQSDPDAFRRTIVEARLALSMLRLGAACREGNDSIEGLMVARKRWEWHSACLLGYAVIERVRCFEKEFSNSIGFFDIASSPHEDMYS